jgi:nucleoside-diphosphate-sugar epimerase
MVQWHAVDLAGDDAEAGLAPAFAGADAVVHLAWGFQPSRDVGYLRRGDIGGSAAVLAAAVAAGVGHLVHMSSVGAYSPAPGRRVDETWATHGIPTLAYSRHKVAVERILDRHEIHGGAPRVARLRPGLIVQRDAASGILRYLLPPWVPAAAVRHLPLLPLDRRLVAPMVHTDDVADAVVRVLATGATGAFNLAAEPPVTRDDIASELAARPVHVPARLVRAAAALAWRARLQPLDPGWLDLAFSVPLLDTGRARSVLGWEPATDARAALHDLVAGMADAAGAPSPALRPRSVVEQLTRMVRSGPTGDRRLP